MIPIILIFLIALFDAFRDTIVFKFDESIFDKIENNWFGNPFDTWENKYKQPRYLNAERFPFSTTLLVFLTDVFHFSKMLGQIPLILLIVFPDDLIFNKGWQNFLFYYSFENLVFTLFYRIFTKKFNMKNFFKAIPVQLLAVGIIAVGLLFIYFPQWVFPPSGGMYSSSDLGFWITVVGYTSMPLACLVLIIKAWTKKGGNNAE